MTKSKRPRLTQAQLKELVHYDPETGVMTWIKPRQGIKVGDSLGSEKHYRKYIRVRIEDRSYGVHRLAVLYMTGEYPDGEVDHINHDHQDNRWVNLRVVTSSENARNLPKNPRNTSGYTGVNWHKQSSKWTAMIKTNGRKKHLGSFDTKEEAIAARKVAEKRYGFHPNHGKDKGEFSENIPKVFRTKIPPSRTMAQLFAPKGKMGPEPGLEPGNLLITK